MLLISFTQTYCTENLISELNKSDHQFSQTFTDLIHVFLLIMETLN